jgi:hypothetical protein
MWSRVGLACWPLQFWLLVSWLWPCVHNFTSHVLHMVKLGFVSPGIYPLVGQGWPPPIGAYPKQTSTVNTKGICFMWFNKHHPSPIGLRPSTKLLAPAEVRGLNPPEVITNFWTSRHWKNLGCHVAPYDWAMCHPMIGLYHTVIMPHHHHTAQSPSTSPVIQPCVVPHHHPYCTVILPCQHTYNPVFIRTVMCHPAIGPCHVWTATCHPYSAMCQIRTCANSSRKCRF